MNLSIRCHGCNHSFRRTAAQVLADGRCPHCSSRDIDLDESESHVRTAGHGEAGSCEVCGQAIRPGPTKGTFVHYDSLMELAHSAEANAATLSWYSENAPEYLSSTAELGEPERGLCPRCNTAGLSVATGTCVQCGYEVMGEHEVEAVDWLLELRRLQHEEGLSFDEAKARLGSRIAAITEPNSTPGSQTCPGCGTANYDGSTCSNCGYTPEDYTKDASRRRTAASKCNICGKPATKYVSGPYAGDWADSYCDEHAESINRGYGGKGIIESLSSRRTAYDTHCPYCGQEGCSPNCPGPSSRGTCPDCGAGTSDGKCNDPQGCGWGWASGDRGLTSDGEPRYAYAAKVNAITADVLASNPGMEHKTAQAIAIETLRRYPVVAKRR